jgi:hypothetical protein
VNSTGTGEQYRFITGEQYRYGEKHSSDTEQVNNTGTGEQFRYR